MSVGALCFGAVRILARAYTARMMFHEQPSVSGKDDPFFGRPHVFDMVTSICLVHHRYCISEYLDTFTFPSSPQEIKELLRRLIENNHGDW